VEVNGETSVLAGDGAAETISASIELYPSFKESWLRVDGDVVSDNSPSADASWLSRKVSVGDTVVIRIVEADVPAPPALSRSDPRVEAVDGVKLVCAFCGKSHMEIQKMYAGTKAVICNECVGLLHQMATADGV